MAAKTDTAEPTIEAGTYRVTNMFVTYLAPKDIQAGGRKKTINVHQVGRFGDEIELTQDQAERLVPLGGVVPADTPVGYDEMYVDQLEVLAAERELDVAGTGRDGHVLKADLVKALDADDAAKGVPAA